MLGWNVVSIAFVRHASMQKHITSGMILGRTALSAGARASGPRPSLVEPVGFLTSYADRQGRAPPARQRLKVRPVDEAPLPNASPLLKTSTVF